MKSCSNPCIPCVPYFKPSTLALNLLQALGALTVCMQTVAAQTLPTTPLNPVQTEPLTSTATDDNQGTALPMVVVTASRLPQTLADSIANTTLITRADIEQSGAVDVPTLLFAQAGIELGRNGGLGQVASIFMRGTPPRNTLVLIDGVPINSQNDGAANLAIIPLALIDHIEIVRGNVSAAYGSNATGGVIQLFMRHAHDTSQATATPLVVGDVSAAIGSQGYGSIGANLGLNFKDTQVAIGANRHKTTGISAQRLDQNPSINPDTDGFAQTTGSISVQHRVAQTLTLGLSAFNTAQNTQYDGGSATTDEHANTRLAQTRAFVDWQVSPTWLMQAKLSEVNETAQNARDGVALSTSTNHRQLGSVQNTLDLGGWGSALLGVEQESGRFAGESFGVYGYATPTSQRHLNALLAGWQGKQHGFGWAINVRHDDGAPKAVTTYAVGASYDLTTHWSVRANGATAFNRPTLGQLNDPLYGNTQLQAEYSRNQEVGVQWQAGVHLVRLTAFRANTRNQFGFDPMTYQTINIDHASNQGVELLAELPMPWAGGRMRASVTSHNPINDGTGLILARRAKQQAHINVMGAIGAWHWDAAASYVGNRQDKDYSSYPSRAVVLPSYMKLDATLGYAMSRQTNVSVALSNLSNVNDQSAYGYSGTPRGAILRITHQWR